MALNTCVAQNLFFETFDNKSETRQKLTQDVKIKCMRKFVKKKRVEKNPHISDFLKTKPGNCGGRS